MGDYYKRYLSNREWLRRKVSDVKKDYFSSQPSYKKKTKNTQKGFDLHYLTDRQKRKIKEDAIRDETTQKVKNRKAFIITIILTIIFLKGLQVFFDHYYLSQVQDDRPISQKSLHYEQEAKRMEFYKDTFQASANYLQKGHLIAAESKMLRLRKEFPKDTTVMKMLARIYSLRCYSEEMRCKHLLLTINSWLSENPKSKNAKLLKENFLINHPDLIHLKNKKWKEK